MPEMFALLLIIHLDGISLPGIVPGFKAQEECVAAAQVIASGIASPPRRGVGMACIPMPAQHPGRTAEGD